MRIVSFVERIQKTGNMSMENRPRRYYNQWLAPPAEVTAIALFSRGLDEPNITGVSLHSHSPCVKQTLTTYHITALLVGTLRAFKVMPYFLYH